MKTHNFLWILAAITLSACGGRDDDPIDDGPVAPPERPTRALPGIEEAPESVEAPDLPEPETNDYPAVDSDEEETCCELMFALPDAGRSADEVSAVLVGSAAPLDVDGGIELEYTDGAWRGSACLPPDYEGEYNYIVSVANEDGEVVFESVRVNPNVDTGYSDLGEVNLWQAAATCEEIDLGIHSATDE